MLPVELIMTPLLISGGDAHIPFDSGKIILKTYNEVL